MAASEGPTGVLFPSDCTRVRCYYGAGWQSTSVGATCSRVYSHAQVGNHRRINTPSPAGCGVLDPARSLPSPLLSAPWSLFVQSILEDINLFFCSSLCHITLLKWNLKCSRSVSLSIFFNFKVFDWHAITLCRQAKLTNNNRNNRHNNYTSLSKLATLLLVFLHCIIHASLPFNSYQVMCPLVWVSQHAPEICIFLQSCCCGFP